MPFKPLRSHPDCPPREAEQANKLSNVKIMRKDYYLEKVRSADRRRVRIRPPDSGLPGLNADALSPKDKHGQWLRRFSIVEASPGYPFGRHRVIILIHKPGVRPHFYDQDKARWEMRAIPGVRATKTRRPKV